LISSRKLGALRTKVSRTGGGSAVPGAGPKLEGLYETPRGGFIVARFQQLDHSLNTLIEPVEVRLVKSSMEQKEIVNV
jgi:hypothetical protein